MRKQLILLLISAILVSTPLLMLVSAEEYPANSNTLVYIAGGGEGVSVKDGNTVVLNHPEATPNSESYLSVVQLMAEDDLKDGFTVKISDIKWDEVNDNAVAIVYGNSSTNLNCVNVSEENSNFTLLVRRDGSIVFWGNGYHYSNEYGKWARICVTDKTLGKSVGEFTYKMVADPSGKVYTFYVNNVEVYRYDVDEAADSDLAHVYSIFSKPNTPCNFGFMVLCGTGDRNENGWNIDPVGTLSYTVEKVESQGIMDNPGADVDGDGYVTNKDLSLVVRYLCGWNVSCNRLDANGDGKVNNRDAIYIIQILNGMGAR